MNFVNRFTWVLKKSFLSNQGSYKIYKGLFVFENGVEVWSNIYLTICLHVGI